MPRTEKPVVAGDVERRLAELVEESSRLARKARRFESRKQALQGPLAQRIKEIEDTFAPRIERIAARREKVVREAVALWDTHFRGRKSVRLPSGVASRLEYVRLEVADKDAVIAALDRLDRLDLVDQVVDMKGLAQLYRKGELQPRLADGAVRVQRTERLILRPDRREWCPERHECHVDCPLTDASGSGGGPKDAA